MVVRNMYNKSDRNRKCKGLTNMIRTSLAFKWNANNSETILLVNVHCFIISWNICQENVF